MYIYGNRTNYYFDVDGHSSCDGLYKCKSNYFLYSSISQKFDSENMFSRRGSTCRCDRALMSKNFLLNLFSYVDLIACMSCIIFGEVIC